MKKLLTPFVYLSGEWTLAAGAVGALATLSVARWGGVTFRGVISSGYGALTLGQLTLQLLAGWVIFSALLYAASLFWSKSKVRAVDLFGNQLFARIAFLPMSVVAALPAMRRLSEELLAVAPLELNPAALDLPLLLGMALVALLSLVWFFAWSWQGFSVAANLRGGKAVAIYVGCYLLAELAAGWCTATIAGV